jgi:hypothetical protein
MPLKPVFPGLIFDEFDHPVGTSYVGDEPCYVVNDGGFLRHIPSKEVDLQVLNQMAEMIQGNETMMADMAAKQLGQEDIFSRAILEDQLKHIDDSFQQLLEVGLPDEVRTYLGMMGFKIRINMHGEVLEVEQPGMIEDSGEE